ncbi:gluconokinase [Actinocorallia libanotica]|uniref:Gluconokinase n=1 Tax=Actinocorallia libanotica TaxID=46162 RepID=A0ABN1R9A9_9ACTN
MDVERGRRPERPAIVVMGVSGSGKSTVGRALAERLGLEYAEGDEFHPPANIAKMEAGRPLNDEDRLPWLKAIAEWLGERLREGRGGVVSCSTLKRWYRDLLREADPGVWFLHLHVDQKAIVARVAARTGHFMPVSLVESQFAALEPLQPDEDGAVVSAAEPVAQIVAEAVGLLEAWQREG